MSNARWNGGRGGRPVGATGKIAGGVKSAPKVDKLTKSDTYDKPKGKR